MSTVKKEKKKITRVVFWHFIDQNKNRSLSSSLCPPGLRSSWILGTRWTETGRGSPFLYKWVKVNLTGLSRYKAIQLQLYPENWHLKYKQQLGLYSISTSISTGFSFRTNTTSSLSLLRSGSPKSSSGSSLKTTWEDSGNLETSKGSSKTLFR